MIRQIKYLIFGIFSLLLFSCNDDNAPSDEILWEIEQGDYTKLIVNQDWSTTEIYNFVTNTLYEGYFIFHFNENGYFNIFAYDSDFNEMKYPISGGQYTYVSGTNYISVDFRNVGQGSPSWPKTGRWQISQDDYSLDEMPNPYNIVILVDHERLTTDLFYGNIVSFKK